MFAVCVVQIGVPSEVMAVEVITLPRVGLIPEHRNQGAGVL